MGIFIRSFYHNSEMFATRKLHIGSAFGAILGGSVIAESVFNLPGLGSLIVLSIKAKDTPSVLASVLLLAVFFALIMLIVDLVYAFIDPRIKAKYAK